jgi:ubiquinone/menaquinone biosynthesis C-methylase UbiE
MENFLTPEEILKQLDIKSYNVAADFGCGSGGWTLPLAKMLTEGKVFATDLLKGPLSVLDSNARSQGLMNVQTMVGDVEKGTKLISNSCDIVLLTNILFECENKAAPLNEAKRVLSSGGKILVVDWKKSASFGPRERAISPEDIKKLAKDAGLTVEKEFEAGPYHYGFILVK